MLIQFVRPKTNVGRFFYLSLLSYLILGVSGCSSPPRLEKPPSSIARAMETKTFPGNLKTVLKASINSLQDMDYTIAVLNSDVGLITANRTTEQKNADLASERIQDDMSNAKKACLSIGVVTLATIIFASILDGNDNDSSPIKLGNGQNDEPDGPRIYRYRITINLMEFTKTETKVRVSASGEVEQDGKILSSGGIHELQFFQKFFAGMNQGLFLDQNLPINN